MAQHRLLVLDRMLELFSLYPVCSFGMVILEFFRAQMRQEIQKLANSFEMNTLLVKQIVSGSYFTSHSI